VTESEDHREKARRAALGKAIRLHRVERDVSRGELAEEAGLSYTYVSEIENGTKQASSKALHRVAEALGLEAHELMASAATWESDRPPADAAMVPPPPPAARRAHNPERWFHAEALSAPALEPAPTELPEVLARIAAALDGVPDERAELALMLSLDERRTRRIVREELDRRS
jgi:transcriptional regulator with XRE-family HTH domain